MNTVLSFVGVEWWWDEIQCFLKVWSKAGEKAAAKFLTAQWVVQAHSGLNVQRKSGIPLPGGEKTTIIQIKMFQKCLR